MSALLPNRWRSFVAGFVTITPILNQVSLGCQASLCDSALRDATSKNCRVLNKDLIAARIDRLLRTLGQQMEEESEKQVNAAVGKSLQVSGEAIRQWRKASALPRLEHIDALVSYLNDKGITTSVEYVLLGHTIEAKNVNIRERIADDGDELELLQIFRAANPKGKQLILEMARAYQLSHPAPSKVVNLRISKPRRRNGNN